ncbi:MAG TPA: hypothetical protein VGF36_18040, partial [Rhodopila sp.]
MHSSKQAGLRTSDSSRLGRWPWLYAAVACLPVAAFGYCVTDPDPQIRVLQQLVSKDAGAALRQAQRLL